MPEIRDLEGLIERALAGGAELTIVSIGPMRAPVKEAGTAKEAASASPGGPDMGPAGESALDRLTDAVLIVDPESGRILATNLALRKLIGGDPSAGGPTSIAGVDGRGGAVASLCRRVVETRAPASGRVTFRTTMGEVRAADAIALPLHARGRRLVQIVLNEVVEGGKPDISLQRALRHVVATIEALPHAVLTTDLEGTVRTVNSSAERLFGRRSLAGARLEDLVAPVSVEVVRRRVQHLGDRHEPIEDDGPIDVLLRGSEVNPPAEMTIAPLRGGDGPGLIVVIRDLRQQKRAELERAQLLGRHMQAQKLEAIGRLAGGIAADVNNILASILGYADLAFEDLPAKSKSRGSVEQVLKAARRGRALVRQIVALGRGESRQERRIRLDELMRATMEVVRPIVPERIKLATRVAAPTAAVMGDEAELHQVILNLCRNAVQATGSGEGRISVVLETVELDPEFAARPIEPSNDVTVAAAQSVTNGEPAPPASEGLPGPSQIFVGQLEPGPYVRLTVGDTGEGMDPATLSHIFEPFFTTRKLGEASGLGLAVVHGIVAAHGGGIIVTSRRGEGTSVEVYLPRSYRATELMADEIDASTRAAPRVLLVEDEPAVAEVERRALERAGFEVDAMADGAAALEAFRADPQRYSAVVVDQVMPDLTGEALSLEISRLRPELPIILCSGFPNTLTLDRVKAAGVREFIVKPVDGDELARTVQRVVRAAAG